MEEYSIFGSNISSNSLLYLKNNESNIKIDIHNNNHNFSLNYINSNEILTDFKTKNIKYIKKIDNNNYLNFNIENSNQNKLFGSYIQTGTIDTINTINFPTLNIASTLDFTHIIDISARKSESDFIFDNSNSVTIDGNNFIKYLSSNKYKYTIKTTAELSKYNFLDENLLLLNDLRGLLIYIKYTDKTFISSYKFIDLETNKTFPHTIKLFSISGNNAYLIDQKTFNSYENFIELHNTTSSIISEELIINIESVLIEKTFYLETIEYFNSPDSDIIKNNILKDDKSLKLSYYGIELYTTNKKILTNFDIDIQDNTIQNVKSLSLQQLVLNDVVYKSFVTQDNIFDKVTELISQDENIKNIITTVINENSEITIVDTYFDNIDLDIQNFIELFSKSSVEEAINGKDYNDSTKLNEYLIPYVIYNKDTRDLNYYYNCNISIKHILDLKALDLNSDDQLVKHSNGIIYKSNKINNIIIDSNITINNNTLTWNPNIFKFTYNNDVSLQPTIFNNLTSFPNYITNANISFEQDLYLLNFNYDDLNYSISHPIFFHPKVNNALFNLNTMQEHYSNSSRINLLNIIQKHNLYITSRFGSSYNLSHNSLEPLPFTTYDNLTFDEFGANKFNSLKYFHNGIFHYYLDFYEFRLPSKVLLKQLQFYDIDVKEFKIKLTEIHDEHHPIDNLGQQLSSYYTYTDKNYIKYFDIIGYDNNWELIQNVKITTNDYVNNPNRLRLINIDSKKKYNKYRITFNYSNLSDGEYANNNYPYVFTNLKLNYEKEYDNNSIQYNGENINFDITKTLSINNYVELNSNNITKLIINEDYKNVEHYIDYNPYAICHINYHTDNTKLKNNNLLKLQLINKDSILPDIINEISTFHSSKDIYNVYHSLHIVNDKLFYTQSVYNKLDVNTPKNQENLSITSSGVVSINTTIDALSNITNNDNNLTGLIINGDLSFIKDDSTDKIPYINLSINSNLTIDNSYKINLPDNCCNLNLEKNYYLTPYNINHNDKIISTQWNVLGPEILKDGNIYIGNNNNSNLFDIHQNFCNIHPDTGITTSENTTHIRKLVIGYPEDILLNIDKINANVLTIGGSVYATNDISTDSDISYKYDLEKINNCKDKVNTLTGYTFNRNDTTEKRRFCGLIAQDVEKILPEAIIRKHDGKLRVLYNNLAGLFVECFKDVYNEIDILRENSKNLTDEIEKLKKEVYNRKDKP